ncbi:MAG: hypothetical protein AAGD35_21120 [Actinomycetota bacterium]
MSNEHSRTHAPRRAHRPRLAALAAVVALALVAAGCSISTDDAARPVDDVPADIISTTTTIVEVAEPEETEYVLKLFFFNSELDLIEVARPRDIRPTASQMLEALRGTTEDEQLEFPGIGTEILGETELINSGTDEATEVLTLTASDSRYRELVDGNPERIQRIYAQIVCTITPAFSGVSAVRIVDDEGPIRVLDVRDNSVLEGPVLPEAVINGCKSIQQLEAEAAEAAEEADDEGEEDDA